ncbi:MAG: hypothetical protein ACP5IT_11925, partial [Thermoproteota archaeon]
MLHNLLIVATTLLLCTLVLFQVSFTGLSITPPQVLLVLLASLLVGLEAGGLAKGFVLFYASYFVAAIIAVILARLPLDLLLGSFAGDLATLVVVRNILLFSLLIALPLS